MNRILIAGFQHETNTFGATQATMADFEMADSWPGLLREAEVIPGTQGANLPLPGFVAAAQSLNMDLVPVLWCAAEPSAHVRTDAYEAITGEILTAIRDTQPDGIYLDLHGAMVTEAHEDGEGELLHRIRQITGPDLPIVISLDLHANVTQTMVTHATAITMFRTYPHLDMAHAGERAAYILNAILKGARPFVAFRQSPYLIPLSSQFTGAPPFDALYDDVKSIGPDPTRWAEFATGFPAADIHDMGPTILAYAPTQAEADHIADTLLTQLLTAETQIQTDLLTPAKAVSAAMTAHAQTGKPSVIADVQDNPGGGATSDTTGLLKALVEGRAQKAVLGLINDPDIAALAHTKGIRAEFTAALGGKHDATPYNATFRVEALSNGIFPYTGEMYAGLTADLGPGACLRILDDHADVRVVLSSKRCQNLDQACFSHIGIDPTQQAILAVKSTLHFRADYDPIAGATFACAAPGLLPCDNSTVPYKNLRPNLRLMPARA